MQRHDVRMMLIDNTLINFFFYKIGFNKNVEDFEKLIKQFEILIFLFVLV